VGHADLNLVRIPDDLDYRHAAALGCRFITAFRAVVDQGRLQEGQWVSVFGCGGVGLSAVIIASALGGRVVAVDIDERSLALAAELGAEETVVGTVEDPSAAVRQISGGGAHLSLDAVGRTEAAIASIRSLRKHGRHVQVGLMLGDDAEPPIPMEEVIMRELEIVGSRGMPVTDYPRVFRLIESGRVDLARLVSSTVSLDEASAVLEKMGDFGGVGVTVIDRF
jgi:alcohol dehydrogenase